MPEKVWTTHPDDWPDRRSQKAATRPKKTSKRQLRKEARKREKASYRPHRGTEIKLEIGIPYIATHPPEAFNGLSGIHSVEVFGSPLPLRVWFESNSYYSWEQTRVVSLNLSQVVFIQEQTCLVK